MLYVLTKDKMYLFPEAAGIVEEILYNIHINEVMLSDEFSVLKKKALSRINELYKVRLSGEVVKIRNLILSLAKRGYVPEKDKDYFTIVDTEFLKVMYIHNDVIEDINIKLYEPGYLLFKCYDHKYKEIVKAYYFDEPSILLDILKKWFDYRDKLFNLKK